VQLADRLRYAQAVHAKEHHFDTGPGEHCRGFPVASADCAAGLPLEPQQSQHRQLRGLSARGFHLRSGPESHEPAGRPAHPVPANQVRAWHDAPNRSPGRIVGNAAELRSQIAVAEQRAPALERQLNEFHVLPEYERLKAEAEALTLQLRSETDQGCD